LAAIFLCVRGIIVFHFGVGGLRALSTYRR
jgi:hypothetical protein